VRVFGVPDDDYHRDLACLFGAQLVRRILKPGYKSDYMIVIKSPENMRKSLFFKTLIPEEFFTDSLTFDMKAKEIIENTEGVLLAEMAEMINITRKEVEHCKHFVSRQHDKARLAYDRHTDEYPRYFTMVGSTNDAKPLQSRTGNRRFLTMDINKVGDTDWLKENLPQIWAEFKHIEANYGYMLQMPERSQKEALKRQEDSVDYSPLEEYLYDQISEIKEGFIPNHEVYAFLGFRDLVGSNTNKAAFRLAKQTFERAGWKASIEVDGKVVDRRDKVRGFFIGAGNTRYKSVCEDGSRICARITLRDAPSKPSAPVGSGPGGLGQDDGGDFPLTGANAGGVGEADRRGSERQDGGAVQFDTFESFAPIDGEAIFESGLPLGAGGPRVYLPTDQKPRRDGPS
jgi:hypothetical protein